MIGIKKYFLIFSLIFYVTACSPPTRDFANSQDVGNSTDDLSTKFINVEGKYEFDLPNTWLDASSPNIREGVNTDLLDMNSPMTKLMFQQMEYVIHLKCIVLHHIIRILCFMILVQTL